MAKIFLSHTKKDEKYCDSLDKKIFARSDQIEGFRSEFEKIEKPEWKTIKDKIDESCALFFLVGEELVKGMNKMNKSPTPPPRKNLQDPDWRYTQNWIAYEIGVACQKGIDVWAICDGKVEINFPMPYVNNYLIIFPKYKEDAVKYIRWVAGEYAKGQCFPIEKVYQNSRIERIECIHCYMEFNFHKYFLDLREHLIDSSPEWPKEIICPQCLGKISLTREEHIRDVRQEHLT